MTCSICERFLMKSGPYPAWIELLFRSGIGLSCFDAYNARFHQRNARKYVQDLIESQKNGTAELRDVSLNELCSDDARRVERALAYLMVVGRGADIPAIASTGSHPDEIVKKAAKTCRFELSKRQEK